MVTIKHSTSHFYTYKFSFLTFFSTIYLMSSRLILPSRFTSSFDQPSSKVSSLNFLSGCFFSIILFVQAFKSFLDS